MTQKRTTLLLALVAIALLAYLKIVEQHQDSTQEAAASAAKVLSLKSDTLDSIVLQNGPAMVELRKKEGIWRMEQPVRDRADLSAIDRLLRLLEDLRHDAKIELPKGREQETLNEFGLLGSEISLKLNSGSKKEVELLLGKDSAVEGKLYLRQSSQNAVFVVHNALRARVTAGADEYRDHRLTATPVTSVQKFTLKSSEGEIELERRGSDWNLLKPLRARAATSKVNDLLAGIFNAQVSQFLSEAPSPEQGLAEPRATFSAVLEGEKEPLVLHLGATPQGDPNKDRSFAKISDRSAVTVVPNASVDPLFKARPNDLRDRKIVRVEADIVDRITFERPDNAPLLMMRKGEGWNAKENDKEFPVKDGLAAKILSNLLTAESVRFVADLTTDLARFGLSDPQLRVRLSSFASENTVESKAGENPIVTILFGKVDGEICYVKLDDEPFIVAAGKALLESLPSETLELLPPAPPEPVLQTTAAAVETLEILPKDSPPVRLRKDDGKWKSASGDAVPDQAEVEAILIKLATLQAGCRREQFPKLVSALVSPSLTIKFVTRENGVEIQNTLAIGNRLKDGTFPATVDGKEGFFLLMPADISVLQRKLLH